MSNPSATGTRCAACRYLRRRCSHECVLAPYFPSTHPDRFACVHRIFGASNVSRMIQQLPVHQRAAAADSISYEAYWRVRDPVYGTVGIISRLQQEIRARQSELAKIRALIAVHAARAAQAAGRGHFVAEPSTGAVSLLSWDQAAAALLQQQPPPPPSAGFM
ncbi:hypothetical protein Taro_027138 [Colocasia esculenta]|uniref:LOB domain-containing protein n=1 Tax=Colocasia esculenta TaxID=4460 RepID=A0A843VQR9_COLES|nr:hypothetical protein [Colocasia esculenta]